MEGGKEEAMTDFLLGTIIGGGIGVLGTILGFIIQGHYSDYQFLRIKQSEVNEEIFGLNRIKFNYYRNYQRKAKEN